MCNNIANNKTIYMEINDIIGKAICIKDVTFDQFRKIREKLDKYNLLQDKSFVLWENRFDWDAIEILPESCFSNKTSSDEVFSAKEFLNMDFRTYKFAIGDLVEVVKSGSGCFPKEIGKNVTIINIGEYSGDPGYCVSPAIGNSEDGEFGGMIGEDSFKLVKKSPKPVNYTKKKATSVYKRELLLIR